MREAELELEAQLESLMATLAETELESEAEVFSTDPLTGASRARHYLDQWVVGYHLALGTLSEDQLTDAVFFDRHPERNGRLLTRDEWPLRQEWIEIRDRVVRPMLTQRSPAPQTKPSRSTGAGGVPWVRRLAPLLDKYRGPISPVPNHYSGEIPLYFLLGWINVESGGQHLPPTKIGELGFFQIHPGESQSLHLDHSRLATDDDYSIWGGVQLVRHYAAQAQRLGFPADTELLWRATKWHHWLPAVVDLIMRDMRAGGVEPTRSWDAIERYVAANQNRLDDLIRARFGIPPGRDLGNWEVMVGIRNVAKTINSGKALAASIGSR